MSIYYFSKKIVMKHSGGNETPIFSLANPNSFLENPIFFLENPIFSENIRNSGGCPLLYTTFRKHRNPVFGHFPSFPASSFMPRVINIDPLYLQYLTQWGVNPGLYSERRSTQTELRKLIYADTRYNGVYTPA